MVRLVLPAPAVVEYRDFATIVTASSGFVLTSVPSKIVRMSNELPIWKLDGIWLGAEHQTELLCHGHFDESCQCI